MIETSLAFGADTAKPDAGYNGWRKSMSVTRDRHQAAMRYDTNDRTAGPMPTFGSMMDKASMFGTDLQPSFAPSSATVMTAEKPDLAYDTAGKDEGFSFGDVVDIVNPLQHLPVIGTLYRKFTGDTIKGFSQIIGGALFGGPIGAVASTANAIMKDRTGKDMTENVLSLAGIDGTPAKADTDLTYLHPQLNESPVGGNLAVANLYLARDGRHNFAARAMASAPTQYWNA